MKGPKVLNFKKEKHAVVGIYIGRPSKWGNPFVIGRDGTREEVIEKFHQYILGSPELYAAARSELRGKNLVCYCAPLPCHGDILLEIANSAIDSPVNIPHDDNK
jgi:hypothetical protein